MNKKIAVIAGTPVDTKMGIDFVYSMDSSIECLYLPVGKSSYESHMFEMQANDVQRTFFDKVRERIRQEAVEDVFVYCNSLAATFDFEGFFSDMRVYTPLMVYRDIATRYDRIAVIAANSQSAAGIEKTIASASEHAIVMGFGDIEIVHAIERGEKPSDIVERFVLDTLMKFFEANDADCLILGCTHFPYLKEELARHTSLTLIDPAMDMYEMLERNISR